MEAPGDSQTGQGGEVRAAENTMDAHPKAGAGSLGSLSDPRQIHNTPSLASIRGPVSSPLTQPGPS